MITQDDFLARGWDVVASSTGEGAVSKALLEGMLAHPRAAGKSSDGTTNVLHAFILSMRPKTVLEIGSHIGFGAIAIGTALKANGFGRSFHLEPGEDFFAALSTFIDQAGLTDIAIPVQRMSTDPDLPKIIGSSVDMVFIDADHSYSNVAKDIRVADSLLAPNGLIFFDDVGSPHSGAICKEGRGGARQALIDFAASRPDYAVIFFEHPFWLNPCGMAIACKQPQIARAKAQSRSAAFRLRKRLEALVADAQAKSRSAASKLRRRLRF